MNATKVAALLHQVFEEASLVGAKEVRIAIRMGDDSRVVFAMSDRWRYRDWLQTPEGAVLSETDTGP
jgi:hypothetical protein